MSARQPDQQERAYTYPEFVQNFMPNSVLSRLHEALKSALGIEYYHQHRFSQNAENPLTGFIEVAKMDWRGITQIREMVVRHYTKIEGFELLSDATAGLLRFKRGEDYITVSVTESATSFSLHITETLSVLR